MSLDHAPFQGYRAHDGRGPGFCPVNLACNVSGLLGRRKYFMVLSSYSLREHFVCAKTSLSHSLEAFATSVTSAFRLCSRFCRILKCRSESF